MTTVRATLPLQRLGGRLAAERKGSLGEAPLHGIFYLSIENSQLLSDLDPGSWILDPRFLILGP